MTHCRVWMAGIAAVGVCAAVLAGSAFAKAQADAGGAVKDRTNREKAEDPARAAFRAGQKARRQEFREQQKALNKEFRAALRGKTPAERCAALAAHLKARYAAVEAQAKAMFQERADFIKSNLASRNASQERIDSATAAIEAHYNALSAHRAQQHKENVAFLEDLAGRKDLTAQAMKSAIKEHMAAQRKENEAFREQLKAERKSWREQHKGRRSKNAKTGQA